MQQSNPIITCHSTHAATSTVPYWMADSMDGIPPGVMECTDYTSCRCVHAWCTHTIHL